MIGERYHVRRRELAEHLRQLGARSILEALLEVERGEPVDSVLASFGTLSPSAVAAVGGNRFPPLPIYVVAGAVL